eukprot:8994703-Lingulodinium_polyedra.AAC.1
MFCCLPIGWRHPRFDANGDMIVDFKSVLAQAQSMPYSRYTFWVVGKSAGVSQASVVGAGVCATLFV